MLFGAHQTFRSGGLLALIVGAAVLLMTIVYFFRPAYPKHSHESGSLPPFPTRTKGYRVSEVDEFFETIGDRTPAEIKDLTWQVISPGYDMEAVDNALQRWEDSANGTGPDPHHGRHSRSA